jgi:hypothetical protein
LQVVYAGGGAIHFMPNNYKIHQQPSHPPGGIQLFTIRFIFYHQCHKGRPGVPALT